MPGRIDGTVRKCHATRTSGGQPPFGWFAAWTGIRRAVARVFPRWLVAGWRRPVCSPSADVSTEHERIQTMTWTVAMVAGILLGQVPTSAPGHPAAELGGYWGGIAPAAQAAAETASQGDQVPAPVSGGGFPLNAAAGASTQAPAAEDGTRRRRFQRPARIHPRAPRPPIRCRISATRSSES